VLPSLGLSDIEKSIEFIDYEKKLLGNVKSQWYDQPTNGISYVRIKANLKNLPEHLRMFVPMFVEFFPNSGTKNYRYDAFNTKLLSCTSGIDCSIDKYSKSTDMNNL